MAGQRTVGQLLRDLEERAHDQLDTIEELRGHFSDAGADTSGDLTDEERDRRHQARTERRSYRMKKDGTPDLRFKDAQIDQGQR